MEVPAAAASQRLSPLLSPSPNMVTWGTRSPGGTSIKDLLAERSRNSPIPPPSPGMSDGGFSQFDSPATLHSPVFNFAAHHPHEFDDESFADPREPEGEEEEHDVVRLTVDDLPAFPPRMGSPPPPPSPTSMSVNDGYSDYSPSPSIGSVRMATVASVPHRRTAGQARNARLSVTSSVLSASVEDAKEEKDQTVWDAQALVRQSFVDRLPQDIAAILATANQEALPGRAPEEEEDSQAKTPPERPTTPIAPPHLQKIKPLAMKKEEPPAKVPKSGSKESELSAGSWRDNLDAAVKHIETDPALRPEADAMQRMKSILGPKMKIISKAPWDADAVEEEDVQSSSASSMSSRRSTDALSRQPAPAAKTSKERLKENVKPTKSRTRSFSVLTSRRANTADDAKEREEALQGLGLGLGTVTLLNDSPTKRPFKNVVKSSASIPLSESFRDFVATSSAIIHPRSPTELTAPTRTTKYSAPAELPSSTVTIVSGLPRSESASKIRTGRNIPPPVVFEMVSTSSTSLPSPNPATLPKSAPPTILTFARSDSHASLTVRAPPLRTSSAVDASGSSPSTPTALAAFPPSPTSPGAPAASYFTAIPGATGTSPASPVNFGHKLISLEEARQRENVRSATQRKPTPPSAQLSGHDSSNSLSGKSRAGESTVESQGGRKASTPPGGPSPSPSTAPLPTPKSLKPKKSGFLKRMMGGDKHDRSEVPTAVPILDLNRALDAENAAYRPSLSSSGSIPTLSSASPPSSLSKATGSPLAAAAAAASSSAPSSRVAFGLMPIPDPSERLRKGAAPSLSLRPISMAFSAGLPSDFLAIAPTDHSTTGPAVPEKSLSTSSSPPEFLVSPTAPSFKSGISTTAPSLFDDPLLSPATVPGLPSTPLTPLFPSSPGLPPSADNHGAAEPYTALQDEFGKAKRAWKALQWELEAQIRALQIELEKTREEQQFEGVQDPKEGEKGNGGAGTLFGSGSGVIV
ncbi:hypothetical protein JCM1841_006839 [Sporobolomyces salmonicolor]